MNKGDFLEKQSMTGVQTLTVSPDEDEIRLDRWFKRHFPDITHGRLEKLLRTGQVRIDGKRVKANQRLTAGQLVRVPPLTPDVKSDAPSAPRRESPADIALAETLIASVLYMDDDVLIIDKPPGLAVQGGTNMERHLDAMLDVLRFEATERPRLVHRLDKDTSGVLVLGRSVAATSKLAAAFRSRAARKCYWALVVGAPRLRQGRIDAPLGKIGGPMGEKVRVDEEDGRRAVTYYRIVESAMRKAAWLEMEPRTGRTHQLRAHCALLGTPIQGDGKYGGKEAYLSGQGVSRKLHLHARALEIPHPRGGLIRAVAPLPDHMAASFAFFGFEPSAAGEPFAAFDED